MKNKTIILLKCLPIILLLIALGRLPYGYYVLMRWIVTPVFIYLAIQSYKAKREAWTWIFAVMAGLYNPLISVHLGRDIWIIANVLSIIVILLSIFKEAKMEYN